MHGENLYLSFKMLFSNNSNNFKPIVTYHFTKSFLLSEICVENKPIRRCPAKMKAFGNAETKMVDIQGEYKLSEYFVTP
jgi:hypothetical protein